MPFSSEPDFDAVVLARLQEAIKVGLARQRALHPSDSSFN